MSIFDSLDRDSDTSKEVQKYLKYFGLENFNLNSDWQEQFTKIINKPYTVPYMSCKEDTYEYTCIDESGCVIKKYFKNIGLLCVSTYNTIIKCEDNFSSKTVIMRISTKSDDVDDLYDSFKDNLKTIVLYVYSKCYIPTKIMPEIYAFGYNYVSNNFYLVMEHIEHQMDKFICTNYPCNVMMINHMICNIYKLLESLNYHGLKFKHSDLKSNNVLIDITGDPLLIDFGFSSFSLPKSNIVFKPNKIGRNQLLNYNYKYPELDTFITEKLNISHDIILFISSLYYIKSISINLNILMNTSLPDVRCILDGREIYNYIKSFFKISTKEEYIKNTYQHRLYFDGYSDIDPYRDIKNGFVNMKTMIVFDYSDLVKYISL